MLRISEGTASVLGLGANKPLVPPRTAYVMVGEGCGNDCAFCAQARSSRAASRMLSRVAWRPTEIDRLTDACQDAARQNTVERICLQVVMCDRTERDLIGIVDHLSAAGLPVSVSLSVRAADLIPELFARGVQRISLPLDVATPDLYRQIKGGDFDRDRDLVAGLAREHGRVGTHLIVGLGETEHEAVQFMWWCTEHRILPALFAFTPLRHTRLEDRHPPLLGSYRRLQLVRHLLWERHTTVDRFSFDEGRLMCLGFSRDKLLALVGDGKAFETSGCPGCNRPFYNERTTGEWYNYARPLEHNEVLAAIAAAEVTSGD